MGSRRYRSFGRRGLRFGFHDDGRPADQRISRVSDDLVSWLKAGNNFDRITKIMSDLDLHQIYLAAADNAHLEALLSKQQSVGGNGHRTGGGRQHELDVDVRTGQQLAVLVWHVDLDQQGAGGRIDGVRS